MVSQKCQYALRAVFELCKRRKDAPVKNVEVAKAQAIPPRFLEVIMGELKQGGFIDSKRGAEGGYFLVRLPSEITVGDIISFVEGPLGPVPCTSGKAEVACSLRGNCVFLPLWEKVRKAESPSIFSWLSS